jgi:Xaa-Pro dipeptidase
MKEQRIKRVEDRMKAMGLDSLIVSNPMSINYLSGILMEPYERMFVLLLRANGKHVFFLNKLFNISQKDFEEVWYSDTDDYVGLLADKVGEGRLGVDQSWQARFLIPLMERKPGLKVSLGSSCVDDCRACKDDEELELMRKASQINDEVMLLAKAFIKEGVTEKQVADFIEQEFIAHGAQGPSFSTIVSFGANAADPHHETDDTAVKPGDVVLIDMGCRYKGYCSDMTRSFFFKAADSIDLKIHDIVRTANQKAEALVRPGVRLCDVDKAARDHIASFGYGELFTHRLGHFIGQEEHESGDVSATSPIIAKAGMVFSIEPGIYMAGRLGVRVEDLVLVTETGCEILNKVEKSHEIIG